MHTYMQIEHILYCIMQKTYTKIDEFIASGATTFLIVIVYQ